MKVYNVFFSPTGGTKKGCGRVGKCGCGSYEEAVCRAQGE